MTRVKICGITNLEDAVAAVEAGADALGFVFADSPRRVSPSRVREIVRALPPFVTTVGVFIDAPLDQLEQTVEEAGVGVIQLHGQESPDDCAAVSRNVIKRIDVGQRDSCEVLRSKLIRYDVAGYLLDPGAGSGRTFDWTMAAGVWNRFLTEVSTGCKPAPHPCARSLVVAGGLNVENVGRAVRMLRPYGVDVCSGVEECPGKKDADKVRAFIRAVKDTHEIQTAR